MKILELNTKPTSYSYPLAKIIISLMIVLFSIFRNNIFTDLLCSYFIGDTMHLYFHL